MSQKSGGWNQGHFTLSARHLPWYGLAVAVVVLATAIPDPDPEVRTSLLVQLGLIEITLAGVWLLLRAGRTRGASMVAVVGGWILIGAGSLVTGGVTPAAYVSFAAVVVLAALLLGTVGAAIAAIGALVLGLLAPAGSALPTWIPILAPPAPWLPRLILAFAFIIIFLALARRQMGEVVRRSDASASLLRATLDATADGILGVDRDGKVTGSNQKFLDLWGIPPELAESGDDSKMIAFVLNQLKDPASFEEKIRQVWHQPDAVSFDVLEFLDGRVYERYSTPRMLDGRPVGRVWSFRDVSAAREAERTRRWLETELFQSQKMEALGRLAGGIAHDFNNILTAIVSYGELARLDSEGQPAIIESLDEIQRAALKARDLMNQILLFSRTRAYGRVPVLLGPVVQEAIRHLEPMLPQGVTVALELAKDEPQVLADPAQVHQVVMNLALNSGQAMDGDPGHVWITVEPARISAAGQGAVPGIGAGDYVALVVKDDGPGMDEATLTRIYEPFFTTRGPGKGRGLGLALVHSIIRTHDGAISVRSSPGQGTTFRVFFPIDPGSASPSRIDPV